MAAAVLPIVSLIAAAQPVLEPVIQALVMGVENLFGGAGTGPAKLLTVVNAVLGIAGQMGTSGKLPGELDAGSVTSMVQTVVGNLKAQGVLTPAIAAAVAAQPIASAVAATGTYQITGGNLILTMTPKP
jgi:hypothetical protein